MLFSTFNFYLFQDRIKALNSRASESKEHCAPAWCNAPNAPNASNASNA